MWQIPKKVQTMFMIFLIIGFSLPIISFLIEYIPNPSIYQDRKEMIKREYENVEPPNNSIKVSEIIKNKITRIWISTDYTVNMEKEEIEKYYQEEMSKRGWKYEKLAHDGTICFTKKDMLFEIFIESSKIHTSIHYYGDGPNF